MQITCSHCGRANPDSYRFCVVCGARLGQPAPAAAAPRQAAPLQPPAPQPIAARPAVQSPPSPAGAPTMLAGRYTVDRVLGRGGMSTVYRAYDTHFSNRVVAVKEMVDSFATPAERAEAERDFLREADLLAALRHPAIPAVFDRFSQNSRHYLVMECIEGENLEAALGTRSQPYPEAQVRGWAIELCALLAYLHEQTPPVIFRDLKPGNILLDSRGRLRLVDFGIARFFRQTQTSDTTALGTSGYASPEHYTGQTDVRSDLYSLGATLHHLLTLRDPSKQPPFQFPSIRDLNPTVSAEMDGIVGRMLLPERAARFASAAEVEAALTAKPRGRSRATPPPPPAPAPIATISPVPFPQPAMAPGTLKLVITRIGRADFPRLIAELAPLVGQVPERTAELLRQLPVVVPVVATAQLGIRIKRLRDLGTDAREILPATELIRLSPALHRELQAQHQIVVWDTTVGAGRTCRCWVCGNRWQTRNAVGDPVPKSCPRCHSTQWSRRRLCKCAWCENEFEMRHQDNPDSVACECCGLRGWLQGRRGGWQGLVQTFRGLLGLHG